MDGNDTDPAIHEWVSSSQFQKLAPEQLLAAVRSAVQASSEEFSTQCGGVLAGWNDLQVPHLFHTQVASPGLIDSACWEVSPSIGLRVLCGAEQRWVMTSLTLLDKRPLHLAPV